VSRTPRYLFSGFTTALLLMAFQAPSHAQQVSGRVVDGEQQPIAHAQLSLRHQLLEKTTTVYSDDQGRYQLHLDEPGDYQLRARRIGYNTVTETALTITEPLLDKTISLKSVPKSQWVHELPASDWFARADFSTEALRGQFAIQCAMCHQQGASTTRMQRSEAEWHKLFDMMGEYGAVMDQTLYDEAPAVLNKAYDFANLDLASFSDAPLAKYNSDVVITEWEVGHATAFLHDMVVGPGGVIYSVDWINDKLYGLDPKTGVVQDWPVPTGDLEAGGILGILAERGRRYMHHTPTVAPHSLQVGPDNKLWITLSVGKGLASFDPVSERFETFDQPDRAKYPHTLRFDEAGNAWYTVSMTNHLGKFNLDSEQFTLYDLPTRNFTQWALARGMGMMVWMSNALGFKPQAVVADPEMNPVPYGIDITPDGKVWFTQFNNRRIGYLDPASEQIEVIDTPFYGPRRMRADSQGLLWIPSYNSGAFYRFNPADKSFKQYQLPTGEGDMAYALAIDPRDDSVWLCGTNSDSIIHFTPASEQFEVFQLPTRVSFTRELEVDEQGNVWTSTSNMPFYQVEGMRGKIIRLSFPNSGNSHSGSHSNSGHNNASAEGES
jgi:virginiamycin B lyase